MTERPVRTRFAPSPTGYLHVGGARTALFSWLYARHHGGQFVLRIEDTDRERSTDESIQAILAGMDWLGLDYDEAPFYQTQHFTRYTQVIEQLLDSGHAYKCYCTKERLASLREEQMKQKIKPRYDGFCRELPASERPKDEPYVIRFKNPLSGEVHFDDMVRGPITIANSELDDFIIARSDGTPTYNFTVVVDDADMEITHVIRGDDHINNTPRQINVFHALGLQVPIYAHVPMILGSDAKRLSKRHGAVSVMQYQQQGFCPEALLNYLVRLGWAHGDKEIFSKEQMIALFSSEGISRSAASFDNDKLLWLNQHYLKSLPSDILAPALLAQFAAHDIDVSAGPSMAQLLSVQAERCKTLVEMVEKSAYFYQDVTDYEPKAAKKNLTKAVREPLLAVIKRLAALSDWDGPDVHQVIIDVALSFDLKLGKLAQPVRVAVTGGSASPPLDATLLFIGQQRSIKRLQRAIEFIDQLAE